MNLHQCKKPFLCSCMVDELAERTSDRMMEIVKEHFKKGEQMTAKEIAERAYERMHGSDLAPNHVIKQLENEIKLFTLHIAEQAVVNTEAKFYKGKIHPLSNYGGEPLTQINELLQEVG